MIDGPAALRALLLANPALTAATPDGVVVSPPGIPESSTVATRVPQAIELQQLGFQRDPYAPLVTFDIAARCYGDDPNVLARLVADTLAPDGVPVSNVLIANRWYLFWALPSGGGADLEDQDARWPMSVTTYALTFDALRGA